MPDAESFPPPNPPPPVDAGKPVACGVGFGGGAGHWTPPTPEELAAILPRYRVESLLGRGVTGAVYKAIHIALQRSVAIKLLPVARAGDTEFRERFHREIQVLGRLQHPGIITIYESGETTGGHLYFAMEFVDGSDLGRLHVGGWLKPPQVLAVVAQLCAALHYAHERGIIHCNLKPSNVLVNMNGRVKLADFALARPLRGPAAALASTDLPTGAADYPAPEQRTGTADHRSDIFALATMTCELLAAPTPGEASRSTSRQGDLGERIDRVLRKAKHFEPARRYQSASELKDDLERICSTGESPRVVGTPRRAWLRFAASGIIVCLAGAVVAVGPQYWKNAASAPPAAAVLAAPAAVTAAQPPPVSSSVPANSHHLAQVLIDTRWAVKTEVGERAWGDLTFREQREFVTMNGPQGEWRTTGDLTVELGTVYVLRFAPDLDAFVASNRSGTAIATGTRKTARRP